MTHNATPHTHGGTDAPECTPYGIPCRPTLAREVADAYAAWDANKTPENFTRVWAAIRAKTLATNPDEWDDAS